MNDAQKITDEILDHTEGLKRVPVVQLPPKVQWGEGFKAWDADKQIAYLTKFAEAMNFAAATIQNERDVLNDLCVKKEQQIESMKEAISQNNNLLQSEITRMNADRQKTNKTIAALNSQIRDLTNGNNRRLANQDV